MARRPRPPQAPNPFQSLQQRQSDVARQQARMRQAVAGTQAIQSLREAQQRIERDQQAALRQTRAPTGQFSYKRAGTYRESDEHEGNWVIDYTPSVGVPRRTVRAAYDAQNERLRVVFARGAPERVTWEYQNVSPDLAKEFTRQASPGRFINNSGLNGHPHGNARYDADDPSLGIPM